MNRQEKAAVENAMKPMKKAKTEEEWNRLYLDGVEQLEQFDICVVEYFDEEVHKKKKTFKVAVVE